MDYKVGQVFYLVGAETARVIPFRVVEEITRTTLEGVKKSFIAEMPDEEKTKVDVSKLKGATFENIKQVRMHMLSNAESAIDKMLSSATQISEHVFDDMTSCSVDVEEEESDHILDDNLHLKPDSELLPEKNNTNGLEALDKETHHEESLDVQNAKDGDIVKVDIGNGIVANMKVNDLNKVTQP